MKVHCLFEQSGTFKNEFKKLGYDAKDYDIANDFNETDCVVDLFAEIRGGYNGKMSIFDNVSQDDLMIAFFPCVRFENQIMLHFRGQAYGQKNLTTEEKMINCMRLLDETNEMYKNVNMLCIIALRRGLKLVIENPYSEEHFLRRYWCLTPAIIDRDRRENGDYYAKPTQYWFINFEPKNNLVFEPVTYNSLNVKDANRFMKKCDYEKTGAKDKKTARSMIHPQYANRFIRQFLIDQGATNEN